jgi:archaellum component FlaC
MEVREPLLERRGVQYAQGGDKARRRIWIIDERLERLTQRHEALTQTVELLTKDVYDMKVLVNDIAEGAARLLHLFEIHEKRIS